METKQRRRKPPMQLYTKFYMSKFAWNVRLCTRLNEIIYTKIYKENLDFCTCSMTKERKPNLTTVYY